MELKKYANGGKETGVLAHLAPVSYAMDKVNNMYNNATSSVINTLAMKARWVYADFPLAFDKDLIPTENTEIPASLQFDIWGTNVNEIKLETKGFGAQGDKKFIDAFMNKYNFDAPGFSLNGGNMPGLNLPFNLPNVDIKSTAINWKGMTDFFNGLNIDLNFGSLSTSNPFKGLFDGFGATLSALSASSPISISGLDLGGMFKFFVGGGMKAANVLQTPPTFISSHYSSTGTMTSTVKYATLTIPLPAARLNYQSPMLGNAVGLVRNDPVGLLTLTKTPKVNKTQILQSYYFPWDEFSYHEENFYEYEVVEDIQYNLNIASGLELKKIETSLVLDYSGLEDVYKLVLSEINGTNQSFLIELEAPVNENVARIRSMPVPAKYFKGRRLFSISDVGENIFVKIKAVFQRKDDPNAQPVVFISTYKTEVINIGQYSVSTNDSYHFSNLPTIPPQNVQVTASTAGTTITWDANPEKNIKYYAIERDINGGGYTQIGTSTTTSFVDIDVQKWVKPYIYYRQNVSVNYRVRALSEWADDLGGMKSQYSAYSDVVNIWGSILAVFAKRELSESNLIPESNSISQNFPNPFNPTTTIYYGVKEPSNVTIKIFNTLGQEIVTLVNERKNAGYYYAEWNATGLPSGIYFYRIQSGNFTESKKMILTK